MSWWIPTAGQTRDDWADSQQQAASRMKIAGDTHIPDEIAAHLGAVALMDRRENLGHPTKRNPVAPRGQWGFAERAFSARTRRGR